MILDRQASGVFAKRLLRQNQFLPAILFTAIHARSLRSHQTDCLVNSKGDPA
jgi:hypothetical protein